ncbi:MAG: sulfatase-like hydrolase/transferase [Bacteroidales bacterium]|nr:sulfatase-like hydrolase/transferase [Bacteroidales bacterium]
MKRNTHRLITGIYLLPLIFVNMSCAQEKSPPNIIFIVTDDQERWEFNFLQEGRYEDGRPKNLSPNIDRLAEEGIIFDQCYVTTSVCTPSRYSILTGQYASRALNKSYLEETEKHGQANVAWNVRITPEVGTIARILREEGYFTGGVGKNHVMEARHPHRIPRYADPRDPVIRKQLADNQEAQINAYHEAGFDFAASIYSGNLPTSYPLALEHHNMDWIVMGALEFLEQAATREKPFFLYFATTLNHGPHRMGTKYLGDPLATATGFLDQPPGVMPARETIKQRIEEAELKEEAADVLWLDDGIGALLKRLENMGALGNTIIFFIDDHGVESGKGSLYQGGILTPAFVWGPSYFKSGLRTSQVVANIDFVPTVLELSGIRNGDRFRFDGTSFLPLLLGDDNPVHSSLLFEIGATRAVIKGNYKYLAFRIPESRAVMASGSDLPMTHICDSPGGRGSEKPAIAFYPNYFDRDQLYDIGNDPYEQINLAGDPEYKAALEDMKTELQIHLRDLPGGFGEFKE